MRQFSAMHNVSKIKAPLLLTTGSLDVRVPQAQSDTMSAALKAAEKDHVYFYYPEEGHDYRTPEAWMSYWAMSERFLKRHLGGRVSQNKLKLDSIPYMMVEGQEFADSSVVLNQIR